MSEQTVRTARRKLPGRLLVSAGSTLALAGFWMAIANGPPPAEAIASVGGASAQGFAPAPLTQRDPWAFPGGFDSTRRDRLEGRLEERRRWLDSGTPALQVPTPAPPVPSALLTQPARPRLRTRGS